MSRNKGISKDTRTLFEFDLFSYCLLLLPPKQRHQEDIEKSTVLEKCHPKQIHRHKTSKFGCVKHDTSILFAQNQDFSFSAFKLQQKYHLSTTPPDQKCTIHRRLHNFCSFFLVKILFKVISCL